MKVLMGLGLASLLWQSGCSTNRHLLEPGHDKREDVSPELPTKRACCSVDNCDCGDCHDSGPCKCRKAPEPDASSPGVLP
ncbi:MAG TPA: hypothetical protein VKU80_13165 [Planctomycetota bacterium]|nr:hypothetical protein [Planctomycetota bacterium]